MSIKESREAARLTHTQVKNLTGIGRYRLMRLEKGVKILMSDPEVRRLSSVLDIDPSTIDYTPSEASAVYTKSHPITGVLPQSRILKGPPVEAEVYVNTNPNNRRKAGFHQHNEEVQTMRWLKRARLTRAELKLLGLGGNPFPERTQNLFSWPAMKEVKDTILDILDERGMTALSSPSGSGKSSLLNDIRQELQQEDYLIIDLAAMERQKLGAWTIEHAILEGLGVRKVPMNSDKRVKMVTKRLVKRAAAGGRTVLIGDDMHDAGFSTLKILRRLREADPRFFLFGLLLAGQETLGMDLRSDELQEISGRTVLQELPTLADSESENYGLPFLEWHLEQVQGKRDHTSYFTEEAAAEIARLAKHPMWVRNLAVLCLKEVAPLGRSVGIDVVEDVTRRSR